MKSVIDQFLADQRNQRPVDQAARAREAVDRPAAFRSLVPLTRPAAGEQYAFEVDLDLCTGCKACVAACHSLNGLEDEETWREVGTLVGGSSRQPRTQTITSACHHCIEPGCLQGCPVIAYEKDPATGIVRHLDDQCIGCSYCILKCPYEVPKYSPSLGIVRKCDMCHGRLANGEAPACVQACPTHAIRIKVINSDAAREAARNDVFLPDTPDPRITVPTTTYTSRRPLSERALAADHHRPAVQHTHGPLVLMLVLTQAGVGAIAGSLTATAHTSASIWAAALFLAGLGASVAHLGQPLKAWRAFLGWRTSWLSREIIVFGLLAPFLVAPAMIQAAMPRLPLPPAFISVAAAGGVLSSWLAAALGLVAVGCSAAVYHDTRRRVWRGPLSFGRFFATASLFFLLFAGWRAELLYVLCFKLAAELVLVIRGCTTSQRLDDLDRSARLLRGPLLPWVLVRFGIGATAVILGQTDALLPILTALLAGELLERALFFKAGVSTRMPGL